MIVVFQPQKMNVFQSGDAGYLFFIDIQADQDEVQFRQSLRSLFNQIEIHPLRQSPVITDDLAPVVRQIGRTLRSGPKPEILQCHAVEYQFHIRSDSGIFFIQLPGAGDNEIGIFQEHFEIVHEYRISLSGFRIGVDRRIVENIENDFAI